jgi:hypothetical protein
MKIKIKTKNHCPRITPYIVPIYGGHKRRLITQITLCPLSDRVLIPRKISATHKPRLSIISEISGKGKKQRSCKADLHKPGPVRIGAKARVVTF